MKFTRALRLLLPMLGLLALNEAANAACSSPVGNAGDMTYSTSANVMVYCDNTNWVSMAGGVSLTVNTSGGGAIPAGSSADVQFNSSGALGADSGNFTYGGGLLKAPNISTTAITASGAGNFGTLNSTGLGTLGSLIVTGGATITGQASITTISTSLIQVGSTGAACTAALAGAERYSSTSNTLEYCSGSAWLSLGPSGTTPIAFYVHKNGGTQTMTTTDTKVTWSTVAFDTNGNFSTSTSRYTVTVPGKYLFIASIKYAASSTNATVDLYKNGTFVAGNYGLSQQQIQTSAIIDMGVGDYVEVDGNNSTSQSVGGSAATTFFQGVMLASQGGGSGGSANPAGTTNDVQFNSGGLLAADTGNFTYAGSTLATPKLAVSGTALFTKNTLYSNGIDDSAIYLKSDNPYLGFLDTGGSSGFVIAGNSSGGLGFSAGTETTISTSAMMVLNNYGTVSFTDAIQVGQSSLGCSNAISGSIRFNPTSNTLQVCTNAGWASLTSNTTAGGNSGDRITSGTLAMIANSTGNSISLTTNGTPWGYLNGVGSSFLPALQVNTLDAGNVSSTLVQTGASSVSCISTLYGTMRWNATSDTIQICNSAGWTSLSSSSVPNTTLSQGTANYGAIFSGPNTLVTDSALYIDRTNHRLGIGTTAPSQTLDVNGGGSVYVNIQTNSSNGNAGLFMTAPSRTVHIGYNSSGIWGLYDTTSSTWRLALDGLGNAGMGGVTAPGFPLEVKGVIASKASFPALYTVETDQAADNQIWRLGSSGGKIALQTQNDTNTSTANAIAFERSGTSVTKAEIFTSSSTARMTITSSGNIGINKINPSATLDVAGTISASDAIQVGSSSLTCASGLAGSMRYTSGTMQVCDGSAWANVGVGVPTGAIAAFALTSCPNGWSEYTAARGRFLRGIDNGAGVDPNGTRAPGNTQADAVQNATGQIGTQIMDGQSSGAVATGVFSATLADQKTVPASGSTMSRSLINLDLSRQIRTSTETRPANIAVIFCQYQGFQSQLATGVATLASLSDVSVAGASNGKVLTYNGSGWVASSPAAVPAGSTGDIQFNNGGALAADTGQLFWDQTNNRLGIGTGSPGGPLEVSGTNALRMSGTSSAHSPYIEWFAGGVRQAIMGWGNPGSSFNINMENGNALTIAASSTSISGNLAMGGAITMTSGTVIDGGGGWHRSYGPTGWYNGTYGGGWYMTDSSYIRSYGSKPILADNEFISTGYAGGGAFRAVSTSYGFFIRNDNTNTYFLLTASGSPYGTWNSLRPLTFSNSTGDASFGSNVTVNGNLTVGSNQVAGITNGTAQSPTGRSADFTGIPSYVKRITVMFNGVKVNAATANILIQLGTSSGIEATGYASSASTQGGTTGDDTTGCQVTANIATGDAHSGSVVFDLMTGNTWVEHGLLAVGSTGSLRQSACGKTLGGTLTQVRVTPAGGSANFSAGSINISYE